MSAPLDDTDVLGRLAAIEAQLAQLTEGVNALLSAELGKLGAHPEAGLPRAADAELE
jgi:hypothetical protein